MRIYLYFSKTSNQYNDMRHAEMTYGTLIFGTKHAIIYPKKGCDLMKYKSQIINGAIAAVIVWCSLMISDTIDEYILDKSVFISGFAYLIVPIALFIKYALYGVTHKLKAKQYLVWHAAYTLTFILIQIPIADCANNRTLFIEQQSRSSFIDLNGIEYIFYWSTALAGFTLLCVIFHVVRIIRKRMTKE